MTLPPYENASARVDGSIINMMPPRDPDDDDAEDEDEDEEPAVIREPDE